MAATEALAHALARLAGLLPLLARLGGVVPLLARLAGLLPLLARLGGVLGSALATAPAQAINLPENRDEGMLHIFKGGGVTASGPALLVRKSLADRVSLSGSYYVDSVSNASIDVVTTASPFRERRSAYELGMDVVVRDSLISLSTSQSKEPDYTASSVSLDVAQEMLGGMTTVNLGYTRAADQVRRVDDPTFADVAKHWQYRLGLTQVLSPSWLMSANVEAISDSGYLGNPYRVARVFGATVPERYPRTRSSRSFKLRAIRDLGSRDAVRVEYRYFYDTWEVRAHTAEAGYSRYVGEQWLADGFVRVNGQNQALFYSDNATAATTYLTRNRQLSRLNGFSLGAKLSYTYLHVPGQYDIKLGGGYELMRFKYSNFTDVRTGRAYAFSAHVLQFHVSATY
ncbi:MAG: DUF3570 domain-containing protein [Burkholderiaceae bacterium]